MRYRISPSDSEMGWVDGLYSRGLAEQMVWLSGLLTFGHEVLARIGRCVSSSVWRRVQVEGARLVTTAQHEQNQVSPERLQLGAASADPDRTTGVSMDGGRGEGWKEVKVGAVYDVALRLEKDERSGEYVDMAHAQDTAHTAVLEDGTTFQPALWSLAVQHEVPTARQSCVTADGAQWIWNLSADLFPDTSQIVDWYHAADHLAQVASALYPNDPKRAQQWLHQRQDDLFLGQTQPPHWI
ncbi:MAG: hypothetical protein ABI947_01450 [Chloroflexota bacterium]